jgi:outer membrane immunogenic protein
MRLTGLSAAILLASMFAASAADLPVKYKAPPPALWSWSGLYGGINAGYSFGRDTVQEAFVDAATSQQLPGRVLPTGAIFGGQIGYNWQAGRWVWGLEGDLQWSGQRDTACGGQECIQNFNPEVGATVFRHDVQWFSTARGRIGLANGDTLLYLTGGAAWAGVRETTSVQRDDAIASLVVHNTLGGWALGGGIEGRLSQSWTVKFEYLHLDFGPTTASTRLAANVGGAGFDVLERVDSRITDNIVRIGVNYRLLDGAGTGVPQADPAMLAWRWSGLYAGLNGGYGVGNTALKEFNYIDPAIPPAVGELTHYTSSFAPQKISPQGALAGGQFGYNWQFDRIVLGVEGDAQWSGQKDTTCAMSCFTSFAIDKVTQRFNWFGTARARLGLAERGYLLYITGGAAFAEIEETDEFGAFTSNFKQTKTGWVAGGGLEAWLTGRWTGKIEYLHADLGNISHTFPAVANGFVAAGTQSSVRNDLVRIGLNYKLLD